MSCTVSTTFARAIRGKSSRMPNRSARANGARCCLIIACRGCLPFPRGLHLSSRNRGDDMYAAIPTPLRGDSERQPGRLLNLKSAQSSQSDRPGGAGITDRRQAEAGRHDGAEGAVRLLAKRRVPDGCRCRTGWRRRRPTAAIASCPIRMTAWSPIRPRTKFDRRNREVVHAVRFNVPLEQR
jgi:hypothetical protein